MAATSLTRSTRMTLEPVAVAATSLTRSPAPDVRASDSGRHQPDTVYAADVRASGSGRHQPDTVHAADVRASGSGRHQPDTVHAADGGGIGFGVAGWRRRAWHEARCVPGTDTPALTRTAGSGGFRRAATSDCSRPDRFLHVNQFLQLRTRLSLPSLPVAVLTACSRLIGSRLALPACRTSSPTTLHTK